MRFYLLGINIADKELPFIPISGINKLRRELLQKLMNKRIECYSKNVQNPISYAKYPENKLDYTANIMNKSALNFYKNCGCESCEFALETKSEIPHNIELMRTKHCLRFACGLCSKSVKYDKKLYLTDDKGKNYPLKFDCKKCEMVVLSP
ncbi:DUF3656 domain-containing protein [bacterium]|nr:DUF3656 domain-containing protein [bacterium]